MMRHLVWQTLTDVAEPTASIIWAITLTMEAVSPLKCLSIPTRLHGETSQKAVNLILRYFISQRSRTTCGIILTYFAVYPFCKEVFSFISDFTFAAPELFKVTVGLI
jgi:hypothetical protein